MAMELFVKRTGEGTAVVLLHGLFGAGANLGALARALQAAFTVYSVDLPSHGRSGWLATPSLPTMADSVQHWMASEGLSAAHFVGHSLGGKVAMQLALQSPSRVASLIVADIAPVRYSPSHEPVFAALEAVVASPCNSREEAATRMAVHLAEDSVIQFLLSSLQRDARGVYHWRFDLSGLRSNYPALLDAPQGGRTYGGPVLFIKGGASDYIAEQHRPAIQALFPTATVKVMPDCGHWLHAEKPQLFNGIVERFLASAEQRKLDAFMTESTRDTPL
jgi:esterase